ncbi:MULTISPECIES: hypothetical protein [unclassified Pseudomonas]|uniref:hypothetical protein n=1 Tax=unclassified Pseudomonas TaxID=196821 RepID=UPI0018888A0F|nr:MULTISPECIES: hypothetical protein [unclassified Pseudomonas]QOY71343.1 hypothetical protein IH404_26985 [Pseudomonas sp. OST1909]WPN54234.1 hypothetical protein QMK52_08785 [Pseudomonas sp. P9_2]
MRYLKVVVKDQSSNAQADTVSLFFIQRNPKLPDEVMRKATAVDITADGLVDYQVTGDIDGNGIVSGQQDRELLKDFANSVLKLSWLSRPAMSNRSINFYVSRFDKATNPVEIRLDFYQSEKPMIGKNKLVMSVSACDYTERGVMRLDEEEFPDGLFDTVDRDALQHMVKLYTKFNWC